ncbi:MAG: polysaccharide pyruvyl transferase family protein [Kiritimatiellae bacterium]|nr:polysaccharide pyruvyl transferase family protein [Kiritimatiellia bacterium]
MKTALYTIFRCTNYGAVLQAYALARTLRGVCGPDGLDVVNHRMDPRDTHLLGKLSNPNTPWFQRWRNRRKAARRYIHPELFEVRRRRTIQFIDGQIRPTDRLYRDPAELRGLPRYATVVVGSDQVWNPGLNHDFGFNPYLCTTLPEGQDRVAYAASFGVAEMPLAEEDRCRKALARFRAITVREESGADLCERLLGDRPAVALDPTLLLDADAWRVALPPAGSPSGGYIAAYWVRPVSPADVSALSRVSRSLALPVCLLSAGPLPCLDMPPEIAPYIEAAPLDFVRTISGASCVVTDSFHGLQFSAVFGRPFIALGNLADPRSNASRLVDFCTRYGIEGGVCDIDEFRRGGVPRPVALPSSAAGALAADRARSMGLLKGLLP